MKKVYILNLLMIVLVSCSMFKTSSPERFQTNLLPEYVQNVYLGMPLEDFEEERDIDKMIVEQGISFRIQYEEIVDNELFHSIIYYFDANISSQPLYEMIFIFQDGVDVESYTESFYGEPSITYHLPFDEWCWQSGEGFQILAWTFENKLVIVGAIKNTEWGDLDICGKK